MRAMRKATIPAAVAASLLAAWPAAAAPATRAGAEHQARSLAARYAGPPPVWVADCPGPRGDPEPGSQAWTDRDRANQYCATERLVDEVGSPAFGTTFWADPPAPRRRRRDPQRLRVPAAGERQGAVPRRGDHHRLDPGLPADVLL